MGQIPLIQPGTVYAHPQPLPPQFGEDLGGGHRLVSLHIDDQDEPGEHQHCGQGQAKPHQQGVPLPEPRQKKRHASGLYPAELTQDPSGQLRGGAAARAGQGKAQPGGFQPLHVPEGHAVLGAQIQKPLRKRAGDLQADAPPQAVDHLAQQAVPSPQVRSTPWMSPVMSSWLAFMERSSSPVPCTFTTSLPPETWISSAP